MKLQVVPASRGFQWVKLGVLTFFRQPLALSGLYFLLFTVLVVARILPFVGVLVAYMLMPGAVLGLMAATKEASDGKFPMPLMLFSAFRAGRAQLRAMAQLGACYAAGIVLILVCSMAIDGGTLVKLALMVQSPAEDTLQQAPFQIAMVVVLLFEIPWLLLFAHAAALVHWHQVPPAKAVFFAVTAILRNLRAYLVYGLVCIGVLQGFGIIATALALLLGGAEETAMALAPLFLILLGAVFTSVYFTFLDSFSITPGADT